MAALVRASFSDLDQWQTSLRSLANQLEDLEVRAKLVVANEAGVEVKELRIPPGIGSGSESAHDLGRLAGTAPDSAAATPAEVDGAQPAAANVRKRRAPSTAKRSTRRKS